MIWKKHPHIDINTNAVELTDAHSGAGKLQVEGVGQSRYVYDSPATVNQWGHNNYRTGHTEWDNWRVTGCAVPEGYPMVFGLKHYPSEGGDFILPSSLVGATVFATKAEAVALANNWLTAGGPGLALESLAETQARHRAERSTYNYGKAAHYLSALTDEDLLKLSEAALKVIAKREETALKNAVKIVEKARKAEEKARLAAEKAQVKAEKAAAKVIKDAEKARKQAAKDAKKAAQAVAV